MRKGRIAPGYDADLVVFDSECEFIVSPEKLHYRHLVSAYMGERLRGSVQATYLRGNPVFTDERFHGRPAGREFQAHARDASTL
jgi:allantoinase